MKGAKEYSSNMVKELAKNSKLKFGREVVNYNLSLLHYEALSDDRHFHSHFIHSACFTCHANASPDKEPAWHVDLSSLINPELKLRVNSGAGITTHIF